MQYRTLGRTGLRVSEIGFGGAPAGITGYIEAWDSAAASARSSVVRAIRCVRLTVEGPAGGAAQLGETEAVDVMRRRYNQWNQHTCDYVKEPGIIREAKARGMGVGTMRTLAGGIFQQLMRRSFPLEMAGV